MKNVVIFLVAILISIDVGGERSAADLDSNAEKQVAQLLIIGIDGEYASPEIRSFVHEWNVGGIILYAYNISSAEQLRRLTATIHDLQPENPPFVAIDQEGGIVRRLHDEVPVIPSAMSIGAAGSSELARAAGHAVGASLHRLGLTMNLAPDLDVLTSPSNSAIGTRSFGDDPHAVAELGSAFLEGEMSAGIVGVIKHFPGEGGVAEDPHQVLPRLTASRAALSAGELVPFAAAIRAGAQAVMVAHVVVTAYDSTNPASLSRVLMGDVLRGQLHFEGVIITDALQMKALHPERSAGELALQALQAGADMVLTVGSAKERIEVVRFLGAAYRDGRLPQAEVERSLRRIAALKRWLRDKNAQAKGTRDITRSIARQAVTVRGTPLPHYSADDEILFVGPAGALAKGMEKAREVHLALRPDVSAVRGEVRAMAGHPVRFSVIVAAASNESQFEAVKAVHAQLPNVPFIFVNLGSPFRQVAGTSATTVFTYSDCDESQLAAADVIKGDLIARGALPVRLSQSP